MKCPIFSKAILFFCLASDLYSGVLDKDNDFQVWTQANVKKHLTPCLDFAFQTEFRFGDDASTLFFYFFQGQIIYAPIDWFEIAPGYRHQYTKIPPENDWITGYSPQLDLSFRFCLGSSKVIDRTRFQYVINELRNLFIFRHRNAVLFPAIGNTICFHPLISEEFFLLDREGFFQNRIEIGGYVPIKDDGKLTLVYVLNHLKFDRKWRQAHVIRFKLHFSF